MNVDVSKAVDLETEKALTEFVMNCTELPELEALLSRFNIFRVLKANRNEIRHSNMLAWLFQPDESHNLGERFLRRWLMRIVHDFGYDLARELRLPSPIEIEALEIEEVHVAREQDNIDLLIVITTSDQKRWGICIENKVDSRQHSNQLSRYRETVTRALPKAEHLFLILLTRNDERPEDTGFIRVSYESIRSVLKACVDERQDLIGSEPLFLIRQYNELLDDEFMTDNRAAQLARQIYKSHRKAIDFILENINDPILECSKAMEAAIAANLTRLNVEMAPFGKGYVRFLPKEWDLPANRGGTAWGQSGRYVICEVTFWTKKIELHITVAKAPEDWADKVWARCAMPPFKQEWKKRPLQFIKPYKAKSNIDVDALVDGPLEDIGPTLLDWFEKELSKEAFKSAVTAMGGLLKELETTNVSS